MFTGYDVALTWYDMSTNMSSYADWDVLFSAIYALTNGS